MVEYRHPFLFHRDISFCSIRRSGSHLIADWLANCLKLTHQSEVWMRASIIWWKKGHTSSSDMLFQAARARDRYQLPYAAHIRKLEDVAPARWHLSFPRGYNDSGWVSRFRLQEQLINAGVCPSLFDQSDTEIWLMRNPYNLAASFIRRIGYDQHVDWKATPESAADQVGSLWVKYARERLGITRYLSRPVWVDFDKWVSSPLYRQALADALLVDYTKEGVDDVSHHGGGSSFNDLEGGDKAKVGRRWERMLDDPIYARMWSGELLELATELYGPPPWL